MVIKNCVQFQLNTKNRFWLNFYAKTFYVSNQHRVQTHQKYRPEMVYHGFGFEVK